MRQSILRYFISLLLVSLCICSATSIFIISGSMKEDSEREMMYSVKLIEYNLNYSKDLNTQIETLNPLAFSDDTRISVIDESRQNAQELLSRQFHQFSAKVSVYSISCGVLMAVVSPMTASGWIVHPLFRCMGLFSRTCSCICDFYID
mgnify:CR=1 FL=1